MTQTDLHRTQRTATILGLAMLLGPLTALSFGSRHADEETLARANAGRVAIEARAMMAAGVEGSRISSFTNERDSFGADAGS